MDDFKPEDELKPDPSDRRAGRSRQSSERSERTERGEPQINFDDVELDDTDERRPTRAGKARREREEEEFEEELTNAEDEEPWLEEQPVERRPRKRKKAAGQTCLPSVHHDGRGDSGAAAVNRGYRFCAEIAMTSSSQQTASGEKSINLV